MSGGAASHMNTYNIKYTPNKIIASPVAFEFHDSGFCGCYMSIAFFFSSILV